MKCIAVLSLVLLATFCASGVHATPYSGKIQQSGYVYQINNEDMPIYVDTSRVNMQISGTRTYGQIKLHANDPASVYVPGYADSNGTNVFDFKMKIEARNGRLTLKSYSNVADTSFGLVSDVMVFGRWTKDAFHLTYSYILSINGTTLVLNSRCVMYGAISGGVFQGKLTGLHVPYAGVNPIPYEVVATNADIDSSEEWSTIYGYRCISPYGSLYAPYVTPITGLPAPSFISGSFSDMEMNGGILTGSLSIASVNARVNVTGEFASDYYVLDAHLGVIASTNGVVTDTLSGKMYLLDHFTFVQDSK